MRIFTYSEARQNLAKLLTLAQTEDVEIRRRDGSIFVLRKKEEQAKSPFDVPSVATKATTEDILAAIRDSRAR